MELSVKERLKLFLKQNGIKASTFCASIDVSQGFISSMRESIQPDKLKSIAIKYPMLDIGWLMTGEGNMINTSFLSNNPNIGNNSKIGGGIGVGNTINVTLPETGSQKIINPDGKIELSSTASNENSSDELTREIASLKEKISLLTDIVQAKDDLIYHLKDKIKSFEHKQ